ncbi:hypothetical protein K504DRAFT_442029 [Pleomassaria siparia CBS 279.74]|uniref:Uncharacterized protein n=1 Tax=Pleomassaria siparia CBS 279.74 TaxID=1314801 RepID=A0A6G1JVQ8_9PLEO|nr:hypothetical protein K504DRAFT_442029 [Pleomassaria siparia CBS 279.74]
MAIHNSIMNQEQEQEHGHVEDMPLIRESPFEESAIESSRKEIEIPSTGVVKHESATGSLDPIPIPSIASSPDPTPILSMASSPDPIPISSVASSPTLSAIPESANSPAEHGSHASRADSGPPLPPQSPLPNQQNRHATQVIPIPCPRHKTANPKTGREKGDPNYKECLRYLKSKDIPTRCPWCKESKFRSMLPF